MRNYWIAPGINQKHGLLMENADRIISALCNHFNMREELLKSKTRKQEIVSVRQLGMWLIKKRCPHLSLAKIGLHFWRDHATVLHGCRTIENYIETGDPLGNKAKELFYNL